MTLQVSRAVSIPQVRPAAEMQQVGAGLFVGEASGDATASSIGGEAGGHRDAASWGGWIGGLI
jgi:hypothetical protein